MCKWDKYHALSLSEVFHTIILLLCFVFLRYDPGSSASEGADSILPLPWRIPAGPGQQERLGPPSCPPGQGQGALQPLDDKCWLLQVG